MTYHVNGDGNKSYVSDSAKAVARVARTWHKNGYAPQLYCVSVSEDDNLVTCKMVAIGKTVKETEKNLYQS